MASARNPGPCKTQSVPKVAQAPQFITQPKAQGPRGLCRKSVIYLSIHSAERLSVGGVGFCNFPNGLGLRPAALFSSCLYYNIFLGELIEPVVKVGNLGHHGPFPLA